MRGKYQIWGVIAAFVVVAWLPSADARDPDDPAFKKRQGPTIYRGIHCKGMLARRCESIIDQYIPDYVLQQISGVQQDFEFQRRDVKKEGRFYNGPNCFGAALNYVYPDQHPTHENFTGRAFLAALERLPLGEISVADYDRDLEYQDIIVIRNHYSIVALRDASTTRYVSHGHMTVLHAAVYLGEGIVFQKKNNISDIYSVEVLSEVLSRYRADYSRFRSAYRNSTIAVQFLRDQPPREESPREIYTSR